LIVIEAETEVEKEKEKEKEKEESGHSRNGWMDIVWNPQFPGICLAAALDMRPIQAKHDGA
jgi:hypothetical protein